MYGNQTKRIIVSLGPYVTVPVLKLFDASVWAVAIPQRAWAYWWQAILFDCETGRNCRVQDGYRGI